MRYVIIPLLLLLLVSSVSATTYLLVPSTPTDVVQGVSFTAEMQAKQHVAFTGVTAEEVAADPETYEGEMLVFIDGKDVTIVQGDASATLVSAARSYFTENGFSVDIKLLSELYGAEAEPSKEPIEEPPSEPVPIEPEHPCLGCVYGDNCLVTGTRSGSSYCDGDEMRPQKRLDVDCVRAYECATGRCKSGRCVETENESMPPTPTPKTAPSQSILSKIISWFKGFFS